MAELLEAGATPIQVLSSDVPKAKAFHPL